MRAVTVLVLGLAAAAMAFPEKDLMTDTTMMITDNMDIKTKQICIMKLLNHIMELLMYKELVEVGKNFNIEENVNLYTKPDVVKAFVTNLKFGFLPRGEIFTSTLTAN
ncbi:hemocyanin, all-alpha domain-containing protein [Phthorimaea operculella]|nr:hemocyanin, all-alpha domain-containing protein [Phthorimaea operculella]